MRLFFERESKKEQVAVAPANAASETVKTDSINEATKKSLDVKSDYQNTQSQEADLEEKAYRDFEKLLCKEVGIPTKEEEELEIDVSVDR